MLCCVISNNRLNITSTPPHLAAPSETRRWWRGDHEFLRERDSCREHRCGLGEVAGDAGDAGAGDCQGEEGQGGALRGEWEGPEDDWVPAGLIGGEIPYEGGRVELALDVAGGWGVRGSGSGRLCQKHFAYSLLPRPSNLPPFTRKLSRRLKGSAQEFSAQPAAVQA